MNIFMQNFTKADGKDEILILKAKMKGQLEVGGPLASFFYMSFPNPNGQRYIFKALSLDGPGSSGPTRTGETITDILNSHFGGFYEREF